MTQLQLRARRAQVTKEAILATLVTLVSERGVNDFSVQRVADAVGVTHRTVYNYFPSRDALLEALGAWLQEKFVPLFGTTTGSLPDADADALPRLMEATHRGFDEHREAAKAFVTLAIGSRLTKSQTERTAVLERMLACDIEHLGHDEAAAAVAILRGIGSSTFWYQLRRDERVSPSALARATRWAAATLIRDLAAGGGPSTTEAP